MFLSIANNLKNISFTKKMYRTFFAYNHFFNRFLWLKCNKKFPPPRWGGNHPQGFCALWFDIDFDPWAITYLLLKFQVNPCRTKELRGEMLHFLYYGHRFERHSFEKNAFKVFRCRYGIIFLYYRCFFI